MAVRLITGGNFINYGARSMLFCLVDDLKKKYPNDTIVLIDLFPTLSDTQKSNYTFEIVNMHVRTLFRISFPILKLFFKPSPKSDSEKKVINFFKNASAIYDISGYGISSHNQGLIWTIAILLPMRFANRQNIPYYILPQSIGPFKFKGLKKWILFPIIKKYIRLAKYIFTRERLGMEYVKAIRTNDLFVSPDIVLQWSGNNFNHLFVNNNKDIELPAVQPRSIGIIPNKQMFNFLGTEGTVSLFSYISNYFIKKGFHVYIIKHSLDDDKLCINIADSIDNKSSTNLINSNLSADQILGIIRQLEGVVSARYHGLVHALKCNKPVFSLGWANKYHELMSLYDLNELHISIESSPSQINIQNKLDIFTDQMDLLADKIKSKNKNTLHDQVYYKYI